MKYKNQSWMIRIILFWGCMLAISFVGNAQREYQDSLRYLTQQVQVLNKEINTLKAVKISGYIQTQLQYGEKDASLRVGILNSDKSKSFNRIGIRRGRIKFTYTKSIVSGLFQLDITERGLGLKDAYIRVDDPWNGKSFIKAGVFDRPFGFEVAYSSSRRESPERSRINNILFPQERDLGVLLTLQSAESSALHFLKLEAAMISGNGIKIDVDNKKDLILHLSAKKEFSSNSCFNAGVSYYNGGVYQGTNNVYKMKEKAFVLDSDPNHLGAFAPRIYYGADIQWNLESNWGTTHLYGEWLIGVQPGDQYSSDSPNYSSLPESDTYIRNFMGGYITLFQDIVKTPLSIIAKYDFYDPNIQVANSEIGLNGTGSADIAYQTIGSGLMWRINKSLRLTGYYEWNTNETSDNLSGFENDLADNVFTLRLQYKF